MSIDTMHLSIDSAKIFFETPISWRLGIKLKIILLLA